MIRDPSDGTVSEPQGHHHKPLEENEDRLKSDQLNTTGLPITKEQKDELKRLEASREWLKEYQARKESP